MPSKPWTTDKFIAKAKKTHGDKYDYSKVNYVNSKTKVTIICPDHGDFEQAPVSHVRGNGCLSCSPHRCTRVEFISKARKLHGDKYDYSLVEYRGSRTHVRIICKVHGEFKQSPSKHLTTTGCKKCADRVIGDKLRSNTEEFISKAKEVHGDLYDYSKVNYLSSQTNVVIICSTHGKFAQAPSSHLSGKGCTKCANEKRNDATRSNTEEFIIKAKKVHRDRYDYSKVDYINCKRKVIIICKEHGEFKQNANKHYQGQGCPVCRYSHGERYFFNQCRDLNISFEPQKTFEGLVSDLGINLMYDFYLSESNTLVEIDGLQHKRYIKGMHASREVFEKQRVNDKRKNKYAADNSIKLVRVSYKEVNDRFKSRVNRVLEQHKQY